MYLVGHFAAGKSILWHAAASSVSIAGIQLSRADSASGVFATARQDAKCEFAVKELGADAAFNTTSQDWVKEVMKATDNKGVDIIVDFVGASYFQQNLEAVAKDGVIVNLGFMGGTKVPEGTDISAFIRKRCTFVGSSLRSRDEEYQGKLRDQLAVGADSGCAPVAGGQQDQGKGHLHDRVERCSTITLHYRPNLITKSM
jgi:NADPH:quinone reductase-like Zn-dependent oxidoreductase